MSRDSRIHPSFFLRAVAALAAAATLALAGCSRSEAPAASAAAASEPVPGGTLRISFKRDNPSLVSLDPFQVYWFEHRVVLRNVVESLTDQDPQSGEIIPWLARSWQVSDDGLSYTFALRDDVTFSNGERFDAQSVKTAFDSNKAFAANVPGTFGATYLAGYDRTEVIDDHTVRIVLAQPNAGFLQATSTTSLAIMAPASYALPAKERALTGIIGSGPFVLERYTPEVGIELSRRAGYAWPSAASRNRGQAWLERVEVRYVGEESVRNGQFLQGEVDIAWPRDPFAEATLRLLEKSGARIAGRSLPGSAFNLYPHVGEGKILADPKVRLALQKAIDRPGYARTIYSAEFPVVEGVFDTTMPYFKSQKDKLAYDPEGAARLLDEAGWVRAGDGWRYKDGQRLTLLRPLYDETAGEVLLQDQLRQAGIELKLDVMALGEFLASISAGKYDLQFNYMTRADPVVLQAVLDPRYSILSALAANAYTPATLARAQALFDAGVQTHSPEARAAAYGALQDLLIDEGVAFPIWERLTQAAIGPRVQGFQWTSEGFALLNDIWLAERP